MLIECLIVAILGGLICLDRTAPQLLISRPIVGAPFIGLLLGDFPTGLLIGSFLELVWIHRVPLGGYVPPDETLTAIVITAVVVVVSREMDTTTTILVSLSFILFLPLAWLGQAAQRIIIKSNDSLAKKAEMAVEKGDISYLERLHIQALSKTYIIYVPIIFVVTLMGIELTSHIYRNLPGWSLEPLRLSYWLLPLIGIATSLNMIKLKGELPIFTAIILTGIVFFDYFSELQYFSYP